jgi:hypothetical protein
LVEEELMALPLWLANLFEPLAKVIDDLTLSKEEKEQLKLQTLSVQIGMAQNVLEYEGRLVEAQASVVKAEAEGKSWLQRNWRPILMLVITAVVANNYVINPYLKAVFGWDVLLELPDALWTLMTVGVGGYIAGRSGEKIATSVAEIMKK